MLKDIEGISRSIFGFNKVSNIDEGEMRGGVQIEYHLKPLDLNWLRKLFNVNPNNPDFFARHMIEDENQDYKLNEAQYEALKPYMIEEPVDFNDYNFFLDGSGDKDWDWRSGFPIQIKNAASKLVPYYTNKVTDPNLKSYIVDKTQETLALKLDIKYWEEFYDYIRNNYPFTELSIYRIDWDTVKYYNQLPWEQAVKSPINVKNFLENTCLNQFKEVVIAYGPREPIILVALKYLYDYPLENLFDPEWGACFIIGATRNKYGIIKLAKECFVEVDCGNYLTVTDLIK